MARILVVEDDLEIQELLKEFLSAEGYEVDTASDGVEGYKLFGEHKYDLILLDIMLPILSGFHLCKMIRSEAPKIPIMMLTALDNEEDQFKGYDLAIDDYVTKPFSFSILIKRVEAVLRRVYPVTEARILQFHELNVDLDAYLVTVNGKKVDLTFKEFEIIRYLLENKGHVATRKALLDEVWGYDYYGDARIVDTHIKNLRKKLGIPYIKTATGVGYKIDE
ncbi:response regulator transcription factor [Paenibacillus sp. N1-5-1-14]|uniref:response regulator transcription factor n=1 Tax=Paenibacillus radicibacter TaxID=2972488 RepID=UPI002159945D|nr:response regulator transcription factor [Paenibacillus radicibacter]MCR8644255.1 response regulator transcription factor [Paenibacillus radicibacter]